MAGLAEMGSISSVALPSSERVAAVAKVRRVVAGALDREGLIRPGERVLIACSGGPDSLALVDAMARLAPPRRLDLVVVHVDHQLRLGSASDAGTVQTCANDRGLRFAALVVDVDRLGGSVQNRARQARYAALHRAAQEHGATSIVLGHTADDQAETVLMRALTGASPRAIVAMWPRRGMLARPLLRAWRADTVAYCAALGLTPLDDPANHDPRHLRTRVRHELLPALEQVFPGARRRLATLAERQRHALDVEGRRQPPGGE